jgi:hypothetical protein
VPRAFKRDFSRADALRRVCFWDTSCVREEGPEESLILGIAYLHAEMKDEAKDETYQPSTVVSVDKHVSESNSRETLMTPVSAIASSAQRNSGSHRRVKNR